MHEMQYKFSMGSETDGQTLGIDGFTYVVLKSDKMFTKFYSSIHKSRITHSGKMDKSDCTDKDVFAVMPQRQLERLVDKMNQLEESNQEMAKNIADLEHDHRVMSKPSVQALLSKSTEELFEGTESYEAFIARLGEDE